MPDGRFHGRWRYWWAELTTRTHLPRRVTSDPMLSSTLGLAVGRPTRFFLGYGLRTVPRTHKLSQLHFRVWFSRTIFESMLIVLSILLALGVRAWQDGREVRQLITRSLTSFRYEIAQNRSRIDDLYRYHAGLQSLLAEMNGQSGTESIEDIGNVLDSLQSAVLLTSAWDTALATGALGEMEYETVFVLSLTYSYQQKFQTLYNTRLTDVLDLATDDSMSLRRLSDSANRYVAEITAAEGELLAAYDQAMVLLSDDPAELEPDQERAASLP